MSAAVGRQASTRSSELARFFGDAVKIQVVNLSLPMTMAAAFKGAESVLVVTPGAQSFTASAPRAIAARVQGPRTVSTSSRRLWSRPRRLASSSSW